MNDLKEIVDSLMAEKKSTVDIILELRNRGRITSDNENRVLRYILGFSKDI